ncbi:helix-turn-helix domain-containing protein [Orenia marismortui]|uniref:helix-turn-helix domain-containing protein n=1 Tax=Orenia marismortui TaxID=46469 RepID=UPI00037F3249|nr:helix-turn-helix transcriptional regulator [Orenia marismortui]
MKILNKKISKLLFEARDNLMSQSELGLAVGVDRSMISNYENSKSSIPLDLLLEMSKVLDSTELKWEAIGTPVRIAYLDIVNQSLDTTRWIMTNGQKGGEAQEMIDALHQLDEIGVFNKLDPEQYSDRERDIAYYVADQIMDVLTCGAMCLKALKERVGINLSKVEDDSERKMVAKGYRSGNRNEKGTNRQVSALVNSY